MVEKADDIYPCAIKGTRQLNHEAPMSISTIEKPETLERQTRFVFFPSQATFCVIEAFNNSK